MRGNPRCEHCRGVGRIKVRGNWTQCGCVTGTQTQRDLQRKANAPPGYDPANDPVRNAVNQRNNPGR